MADGSIVFEAKIDDEKAQKELDRLNRKIDSLKTKAETIGKKRSLLTEDLRQAQKEAINAYNEVERLQNALKRSQAATSVSGSVSPEQFMEEKIQQERLTSELKEQEKVLRKKEAAAERLEAKDRKLVALEEQITAEMRKQEEAAGEIHRQLTNRSTQALRQMKEATEGVTQGFRQGLKSLVKYGLGIRSLYVLANFLRRALVDGFKNLVQFDSETNRSISGVISSLEMLKNSLATAFAPIVNIVAPILTRFINLLAEAANYVGMFFAVVTGKSTYTRAIAVQKDYAASLQGTANAAGNAANAAEDALKQFSGLDEISTFESGKEGGGYGVGGGGISYGAVGPLFEEVDIDKNSGVAKFASFVLDHLDEIKIAAAAVGSAILGWSISSLFTNALGGVVGQLKLASLFAGAVTLGAIVKGNWDLHNDEGLQENIAESTDGFYDTYTEAFEAAWEKNSHFAGNWFTRNVSAVIPVQGKNGKWFLQDAKYIKKGGMTVTQWMEENGIPDTSDKSFTIAVSVERGKVWVKEAWEAAQTTAATVVRTLRQNVQRGATWVSEAWAAVKTTAATITRTLLQNIKKGTTWVQEAWEVFKGRAATAVSVGVSLFKSGWTSLKDFVGDFSKIISLKVEWYWPSSVWWQNVSKLLGFNGYMPYLRFAARGGIVDGASLFGNTIVGEAGKEAIIPLERHTEWLDLVAGRLSELLSKAKGGMFDGISDGLDNVAAAINRMTAALPNMEIAMPAMASGTVVPPGLFTGGEELNEVLSGLKDVLSGLRGGSNGGNRSYSFTAMLNRRELFREIIDEAKLQQGQTGKNPFDL